MSVSSEREALTQLSPAEIRRRIRAGEWRGHTAGLAPNYVQANLVVLPREDAYDFLLFCVRNPQPCPLLEVTDVGSPLLQTVAPGADLRTDLPKYRVYERGELVAEPETIVDRWRDELVGFLLGCSYTFEYALDQAGIPVRHWEQSTIVPMYRTTRQCVPAGRFRGPLVVSMRPIPAEQIELAVELTQRYPQAHGAPVQIGEPAALGVSDVARPDWGDPSQIQPGEEPVFWACGVTPQAVAAESKPSLMITHAPGHMFLTDLPISAPNRSRQPGS